MLGENSRCCKSTVSIDEPSLFTVLSEGLGKYLKLYYNCANYLYPILELNNP